MSNRKNSFVDSAVQGSLVKRVLAHWLVFFVVLMLVVGFFNILLGAQLGSVGEKRDNGYGPYVLLSLIMVSLLPAFMLDTIRFSNRIVGPIYRLRMGIRQLAQEGDAPHLKFRDNDFWMEAANEFNQLVDATRKLKEQQTNEENRGDISEPQEASVG